MNSDVLAKNLELLVGQDQAKHLLSKCLATGNCSAYLLVGPPYVGKGFLARLMAASLHSETNVYKIHPDTMVFDDILMKNSGEEEDHKWKQSVDDFIHSIYLSPVTSPHKVGIVENIDRFSVAALNALLKTLEEPPARAVLILTAQEMTSILPTILSRVQIIRLHYLSDSEMTAYVQSKTTEQVTEITMLANGAVGMANRLLADSKFLAQAIQGINNWQTWLDKDIVQMLQMANIKERAAAIDLVNIWLNLARRAWLDKLNGRSSYFKLDGYSETVLLKLIDRLKLALVALDANANVRMTLEATLLSII